MKHLNFLTCFALALGSLWVSGCSKQESPPAAPEVANTAPVQPTQPIPAPQNAPTVKTLPPDQPESVPGERRVRDALARQDYNGAVAALFSIKPTPQEWEEYRHLYAEVKDTVMEASAYDRNAAQALMAIRMASAGR